MPEQHGSTLATHKLDYYEACSLLNSGYYYADGYDSAVCTCGWKSAGSRSRSELARLYEIHLRNIVYRNGFYLPEIEEPPSPFSSG